MVLRHFRGRSASVLSSVEVYGEGDITVPKGVPSKSLQFKVIDCSNLQSLPRQRGSLPKARFGGKARDGLKVEEDQGARIDCGLDFHYRPGLHKMPLFRLISIYEVRVPS